MSAPTPQSPARARVISRGTALLDRLSDQGFINATDYARCYHGAKDRESAIEDELVLMALVSETDLLRLIAGTHGTQFVTAESLFTLKIERELLEVVPEKAARKLECFPMLGDADTETLTVVAVEPTLDLARQLEVVTSLRQVRVLAALPQTIDAAIAYYYGQDRRPLDALRKKLKDIVTPVSKVDPGELRIVPAGRAGAGKAQSPTANQSEVSIDLGPLVSDFAPAQEAAEEKAFERSSRKNHPVADPTHNVDISALDGTALQLGTSSQVGHPPSWNRDAYEMTRTLLLGTSGSETQARVSDLLISMARRKGFSEPDVYSYGVLGLIYSIGRSEEPAQRLTALNVSRFDALKHAAIEQLEGPFTVFPSVRLPTLCVDGIRSLFERFDGAGFPRGVSGETIPLSARLVSLADTYVDLSLNPSNPYGRCLSPKEAFDVVRQLAPTLFDPVAITLLQATLIDEIASTRILATKRVLLIDPDTTLTTDLTHVFRAEGFTADTVTGFEDAIVQLRNTSYGAVLCEYTMGIRTVWHLLSALRSDPRSKDAVLMVLSSHGERTEIQQLFSVGLSDWLFKPSPSPVVVQKVANAIETSLRTRRIEVLAGSIKDTWLPDVVEVLMNSEKSGVVDVETLTLKGRIALVGGSAMYAEFGSFTGEDAFFKLMRLIDGQFRFTEGASLGTRNLTRSTPELMRDAMTRLNDTQSGL